MFTNAVGICVGAQLEPLRVNIEDDSDALVDPLSKGPDVDRDADADSDAVDDEAEDAEGLAGEGAGAGAGRKPRAQKSLIAPLRQYVTVMAAGITALGHNFALARARFEMYNNVLQPFDAWPVITMDRESAFHAFEVVRGPGQACVEVFETIKGPTDAIVVLKHTWTFTALYANPKRDLAMADSRPVFFEPHAPQMPPEVHETPEDPPTELTPCVLVVFDNPAPAYTHEYPDAFADTGPGTAV